MHLHHPHLETLPTEDLYRGFRALADNPFFLELLMRAQENIKSIRITLEGGEPDPQDVNHTYRVYKYLGEASGIARPFEVLEQIVEELRESLQSDPNRPKGA